MVEEVEDMYISVRTVWWKGTEEKLWKRL